MCVGPHVYVNAANSGGKYDAVVAQERWSLSSFDVESVHTSWADATLGRALGEVLGVAGLASHFP